MDVDDDKTDDAVLALLFLTLDRDGGLGRTSTGTR
jgi:hypothetical protein